MVGWLPLIFMSTCKAYPEALRWSARVNRDGCLRFTHAGLSRPGMGTPRIGIWLSKPMVPWGGCTTHFRFPILVGIESDVHWGYGLLTHSHLCFLSLKHIFLARTLQPFRFFACRAQVCPLSEHWPVGPRHVGLNIFIVLVVGMRLEMYHGHVRTLAPWPLFRLRESAEGLEAASSSRLPGGVQPGRHLRSLQFCCSAGKRPSAQCWVLLGCFYFRRVRLLPTAMPA